MLVSVLFIGCLACFLLGYIHRNILNRIKAYNKQQEEKRIRRARRSLFTDLKQARREAFTEVL